MIIHGFHAEIQRESLCHIKNFPANSDNTKGSRAKQKQMIRFALLNAQIRNALILKLFLNIFW